MTLGANRLTIVTVAFITLLVVGIPLERSRDVSAVINFLVPFGSAVAIFAILAIGLNVQWGYTGVFNFGIAGFFMVGAYTGAIFTKDAASGTSIEYIGGWGDQLAFLPFFDSREWLPHLIGMLAAGVFCAALALVLALPILRLREDYLAICTIGIAEVLRRIVIEEDRLANATRGLTAIPRPLSGWVEPENYKYVAFAIIVTILITIFIAVEGAARSPWGRVLRAVREDEQAAAASGKNVFGFKLQSFCFGAAIMGMGGALYGYEQGAIAPDTFTHFFGTFIIWTMLIVGGSGNNAGAILGAYIVWGFWTTSLQIQSYPIPDVLRIRVFYIRDFLVGAIIVLILLMRPQGLLPEQRRVSRWLERRVSLLRRAERKSAELPPPPPDVAEQPAR